MSNRHLIGRRQFLIVTSTCAVAAATVGPKLFAGERASQPKRLAVGFAPFEENAVLVDASSVPAGDGKFIGRGARIVASGASGASADPQQRRAVELLAHYSYLDGAERLTTPFLAWACSRVTGCQGNGVGFTVPVDEVQKIVFTVGVETGTPVAASRRAALTMDTLESTPLPLTLSLQNEAGTVKLARGFYVVVPMFENDGAPSWSSWQLGTVDGRRTLVDRDGNAAPFEHFVLKIDYAD